MAERINGYVAYNEALEWGVIRNGEVSIGGVNYKPTIPVRADVAADIERIMKMSVSETYKAIKYMYYAMRKQLFWDGNKRTAILSANYLLLQKGKGILINHEKHLEQWNVLLTEFYETNYDQAIIDWTYENCILNKV
ncbi:Fic family protein [Paenibacillus xylaniclasticus]|uniref:Fic family protein n=1 Tax=Paenibacillus xylaniclasticus TaxID=588083 RepID=UPI000FDCD047